jgi:hypothetical protein
MKKNFLFLFLLLIICKVSAREIPVGIQIGCNAGFYFQEINMGGDLGSKSDYRVKEFSFNENIYQFTPFWSANLYDFEVVFPITVELGSYMKYPNDVSIYLRNKANYNICSLNNCIKEALGVEWKGTKGDLINSVHDMILLNNGDVLVTLYLSQYKTIGTVKIADTFLPIGSTGITLEGANIPQVITTTQKYGLIFSRKKSYKLEKICKIPNGSQLISSVYGGFYCLDISEDNNPRRQLKYSNILEPFTTVCYYNNEGVFQWFYKANEGEKFYTINQTESTVFCGGYTKNKGYVGFRNSYAVYLDSKSGDLKETYHAPKILMRKDAYIYNIRVGAKNVETHEYDEVELHCYWDERNSGFIKEKDRYAYIWLLKMNESDKVALKKIADKCLFKGNLESVQQQALLLDIVKEQKVVTDKFWNSVLTKDNLFNNKLYILNTADITDKINKNKCISIKKFPGRDDKQIKLDKKYTVIYRDSYKGDYGGLGVLHIIVEDVKFNNDLLKPAPIMKK